jgi:glycosyltransferase involved in cell wall biosynthesis
MAKILVIDPFPPAPDTNSGARRLFEILRLMKAEGHNVTFMPQNAYYLDQRYVSNVRNLGIEVRSLPPGDLVDEQTFRDFFTGKSFDFVVISFYHVAKLFLPLCRELFPKAKIIIDTVDLHFVREERRALLTQDATLATQAMHTRRSELSTYAKADSLWAITPDERDVLLSEVAVQDIAVVPNIHEVKPLRTSFSDRDGLLFVANFNHPPNAEGIAWFCQEILPVIRARFPDLKTRVVGNEPPAFLQQFAHLGVELQGWVQDLEPLLSKSRISIAPLLHGAGMKGKVGEALAAGLPCVTTPIGSEGMGLTHGSNVLVADNATAFASAVILAYSNEDLWSMLAVNGPVFMEERYTPRAIRAAIHDVFSEESDAYVAVPNWQDADAVKAVVNGYVRKHTGSSKSTLCLGVVDLDVNDAADSLVRWIGELGFDIETIPNIDLTPMTIADLERLDSSMAWVPMSNDIPKPAQLTVAASLASTPVNA